MSKHGGFYSENDKQERTPINIYSDNGCEFNNKETVKLSQKYGFSWSFNSPGHHSATGMVERTIQTLFNKLKKLSDYGTRNWEKYIQNAVDATNFSYQAAIKTSPYIFRYGKQPLFSIDLELNAEEIIYDKTEILYKRNKTFDDYSKKMIVKGKKTCENQFNYNDPVLVFKNTNLNKFDKKWHSGFYIKEQIHENSFLVEKNNKSYRVNKKHIRHDFTKREEKGVMAIS